LADDIDDNVCLAVTEFSYTQFLSPKFGTVLGKFQTLDGDPNEFASGRGRSQFLNASFIFNPVTALTVPYSTLGGGVVLLPTSNITITSLVYNTTDASTTTGFSDIGDGWTWSTEAQFQYRLGGLPGGQNAAFIYAADGEFLNFARSSFSRRRLLRPRRSLLLARDDDSWAAYWSAWQYLYTPDEVPDRIDVSDGRADLRGIGLFARFGIADDETNPIEWTVSAGVGGRGMLFGRDDDTFGVGFAYTDIDRSAFASALGFDDEAYGVETYYNIAISPGVSLTLDAQVSNTALEDVDTTTMFGARLNIRF
jgi:porin